MDALCSSVPFSNRDLYDILDIIIMSSPSSLWKGWALFALAHYTHQAAKLEKLLGDGRWYLVVLMDIHGNT